MISSKVIFTLTAILFLQITHGLSENVTIESDTVDNSKCGAENGWSRVDFDTHSASRHDKKVLKASSFSCASFPINIIPGKLIISVYMEALYDSKIDIIVRDNEKTIVNYVYDKSNVDFEQGWHTITLSIDKKTTAYVTLLGFSQKEDTVIVESIQYHDSTLSNSKHDWTREKEEVKIIDLISYNKDNFNDEDPRLDTRQVHEKVIDENLQSGTSQNLVNLYDESHRLNTDRKEKDKNLNGEINDLYVKENYTSIDENNTQLDEDVNEEEETDGEVEDIENEEGGDGVEENIGNQDEGDEDENNENGNEGEDTDLGIEDNGIGEEDNGNEVEESDGEEHDDSENDNEENIDGGQDITEESDNEIEDQENGGEEDNEEEVTVDEEEDNNGEDENGDNGVEEEENEGDGEENGSENIDGEQDITEESDNEIEDQENEGDEEDNNGEEDNEEEETVGEEEDNNGEDGNGDNGVEEEENEGDGEENGSENDNEENIDEEQDITEESDNETEDQENGGEEEENDGEEDNEEEEEETVDEEEENNGEDGNEDNGVEEEENEGDGDNVDEGEENIEENGGEGEQNGGEGENSNENENNGNESGSNSNNDSSFWNIWTITLVSVASGSLIALVVISAYNLGKNSGGRIPSPIDLSDLEAPRIIPRVKTTRPPYERFGSEYGGSN